MSSWDELKSRSSEAAGKIVLLNPVWQGYGRAGEAEAGSPARQLLARPCSLPVPHSSDIPCPTLQEHGHLPRRWRAERGRRRRTRRACPLHDALRAWKRPHGALGGIVPLSRSRAPSRTWGTIADTM